MKRRMNKVIMTFCMIFVAVFFTVDNVSATEWVNSVLQIVVLYTDDEGNTYPIQGGSGFLIGNEQAGAEYLVTAKEVTNVSDEIEYQIKEKYLDAEKQDTELTYKIKAVVTRDVMVDVKLVAESEEMGFGIWKLSQPLYDRQALVINDQEKVGIEGQNISVLGFLTAPEYEAEAIYYTKEEMIHREGQLIETVKEGNVEYLYHTVEGTKGMTGGPILNEDGQVLALYQSKQAENGYYALQMSEVLPVLEALGIPYVTSSEIEARKKAELEALVHKEELQKAIEIVNELDAQAYTKASYEAMQGALEEAVLVNGDENATQEMVDTATANLSITMDALKEKLPTWLVIVMCVLILCMVVSAFLIVWIQTESMRKRKKQKRYEEFTVTEAAPIFTQTTNIQKANYKELVAGNSLELGKKHKLNGKTIIPTQIPQALEPYQNFESADTTVFTQDNGDTVVLQYEERKKKKTACLVREYTGEKIHITEQEFVIGKDPSQTDYSITGNTAISRTHVVIIQNNDTYEVADKNATNGTFVNGKKVEAFQKMILKDGDVLRLADENFTFCIVEEA